MTRRTIGTRMFRMIESNVETAQRWKWFHLSALRISMAIRTDLTAGIGKLLLVTTRAGRVRVFSGHGRPC